MKNTIYGLILLMAMTSCQTAKKKFIQKRDYSFITDSLKIDEKLEQYKLAGFSMVVFENYEVVYTNQFGIKSMKSKEKIDIHTAFSTASIAKPITALLCHILEEKGLINLDDPIDNYLKRWNLPQSKFIENNSPTWKQFLNHTAGTSQHGFADFYTGDTNIPTIKQSLLGQLPRYNNEIEFLFTPGSSWKYSGGGYTIVQMALEDALNKPIAVLADEHIFSPMGLKNTTMIQPNEDGFFLTNVALAHDQNNEVIKTGLTITPQVGPSGLWSTPTDLAKITIELQNALRNKNNRVISNTVAKKLTKVTALKGAPGGWSYGGARSFGFNGYDWLWCNGSNTGVGGDIHATMTDGNGFIFLANGEKPNRFPVIDQTLIKLVSIMDWNKKKEEEIIEIPSDLKENLIGTYNDFLHGGQPFANSIFEKDHKLYVESIFFERFNGQKASEMIYLKYGLFRVVDYPNLLKFNMKNGKPYSVNIIREDMNVEVALKRNK